MARAAWARRVPQFFRKAMAVLLLTVSFSLVFAADGASLTSADNKEEERKEREKLVGTWIGTKHQMNGVWNREEAKLYHYTISTEKFTLKYNGEVTTESSYALDIGSSPK